MTCLVFVHSDNEFALANTPDVNPDTQNLIDSIYASTGFDKAVFNFSVNNYLIGSHTTNLKTDVFVYDTEANANAAIEMIKASNFALAQTAYYADTPSKDAVFKKYTI